MRQRRERTVNIAKKEEQQQQFHLNVLTLMATPSISSSTPTNQFVMHDWNLLCGSHMCHQLYFHLLTLMATPSLSSSRPPRCGVARRDHWCSVRDPSMGFTICSFCGSFQSLVLAPPYALMPDLPLPAGGKVKHVSVSKVGGYLLQLCFLCSAMICCFLQGQKRNGRLVYLVTHYFNAVWS